MHWSGPLTLHFSFYWTTGDTVWDLVKDDNQVLVPYPNGL